MSDKQKEPIGLTPLNMLRPPQPVFTREMTHPEFVEDLIAKAVEGSSSFEAFFDGSHGATYVTMEDFKGAMELVWNIAAKTR